MNEAPFEISEEYEVSDMTNVQEDLLPVASKVLFLIKKASAGSMNLTDSRVAPSEENPVVLRKLRLELRIKEGIQVGDQVKYANKPVFVDLLTWANPTHKTSEFYSSGKYLLPLKQFCKAVGQPIQGLKINDEFYASLVGMELRADIRQVPIREQDETGKWVATPDLQNEYRNFRAA